MIIKMPILEHTPTKFETVQYFTTEKLKDIVDNPKGKIGTKAQLEELKVYLFIILKIVSFLKILFMTILLFI